MYLKAQVALLAGKGWRSFGKKKKGVAQQGVRGDDPYTEHREVTKLTGRRDNALTTVRKGGCMRQEGGILALREGGTWKDI